MAKSTVFQPITIEEAQECFNGLRSRNGQLDNTFWSKLNDLGETWVIHNDYPHLTTTPFQGVLCFFYKNDGRIKMLEGASDGKWRWPDGLYD